MVLLAGVGCGDNLIDVQQDGSNADVSILEGIADHRHGELHYLKSEDEVAAAFASGQMLLQAASPFESVTLMVTTTSASQLEMSTRASEGDWAPWRPVTADWRQGAFWSTTVVVPRGSIALGLRGGEGASFMRIELMQTNVPEGVPHFDDDHDEDVASPTGELDEGIRRLELARSGRWTMPSSVRDAGERQFVAYTGAPSWDPSRCGGNLLSGTRELGEYLVATFDGARYYQGYSCRRNTASRNRMSVHGTGRALDVFVPLHRGQADNDLGDPVANFLVQNAEAIGIQYIIWDRASWGGSRSGRKDRDYTGPHPHHDHLHIELTPDAAARRTAWFRDRGVVTPPDPGGGGDRSCFSRTLGAEVEHGRCVQMAHEVCGGACKWAQCVDGAWSCVAQATCPADGQFPHSSCVQEPSAKACFSRTLGQHVDDGDCVQMDYNSCGGQGTCLWAECTDGAWTCKDAGSCRGTQHGHANCSAPPAAPAGESCWSRTKGQNIPHGECVQMSYNACGGTCQWAACVDGAWSCTPASGCSSTRHGHRACGN